MTTALYKKDGNTFQLIAEVGGGGGSTTRTHIAITEATDADTPISVPTHAVGDAVVFYNGVLCASGDNYAETTSTIAFNFALEAGDEISVLIG